MDPIIGGALIKGGLGLLGGLFGQRSRRKQAARQEYLRSPAGIRAESEKAGFNPLTVLQSGRDFAADLYRPVIGDALANAGMAVGDGMQQAAMENTRLQMHNDNLKARLKALSLKPVPNMYGRTNGTGQPISGRFRPMVGPGVDTIGAFSFGSADSDGGYSGTKTTDEFGNPATHAFKLGGGTVTTDRRFTDAEVIGDRYSDIPENIYGIGLIGVDMFEALRKKNAKWMAAEESHRKFTITPQQVTRLPSRGSGGRRNTRP